MYFVGTSLIEDIAEILFMSTDRFLILTLKASRK